MHCAIEITLAPEGTERLMVDLVANKHVVGLSVQRGASVKPLGDLVVVQVGSWRCS